MSRHVRMTVGSSWVANDDRIRAHNRRLIAVRMPTLLESPSRFAGWFTFLNDIR